MILLFAANTFNIAADIAAMGSGIQLLWPGANFARRNGRRAVALEFGRADGFQQRITGADGG